MVARQALQADAARLSAPLLLARVARAQDRLGAARLAPALVTQRIAAGQERLQALARLSASLNPDRVLERGYVRVTALDGRTVISRAVAAGEAALELHFRDGVLAVMPGAVDAAKPRPAPKPAAKPAPPEQGKLL